MRMQAMRIVLGFDQERMASSYLEDRGLNYPGRVKSVAAISFKVAYNLKWRSVPNIPEGPYSQEPDALPFKCFFKPVSNRNSPTTYSQHNHD